jgi:hypothetical protein
MSWSGSCGLSVEASRVHGKERQRWLETVLLYFVRTLFFYFLVQLASKLLRCVMQFVIISSIIMPRDA